VPRGAQLPRRSFHAPWFRPGPGDRDSAAAAPSSPRRRWAVLGACLAAGAIAAAAWPSDAANKQSAAARQATLSAEGPAEPVVADWPFTVRTTWTTDVARGLSVLVLRAPSCGANVAAGLRADRYGLVLVDALGVEGSGTRSDEGTLTITGSYLVCGYLQSSNDPAVPADVVAQAPRRLEITTHPQGRSNPARKGRPCGRVGGPRRITRVRAVGVSCRAARAVARRWGRARPARERVGGYTCRTSGRRAVCTASAGRRVRFRFR
jgi:hypothetical protein